MRIMTYGDFTLLIYVCWELNKYLQKYNWHQTYKKI
jgi:hypothetical protein